MAATTTTTSGALSMKLLIDTKAQRVPFAEAGKDAVDFLFSLLALPVGTTVKLLGKKSMVGCVGNLYASVEKLDGTYIQPGAAKDALLSPTVVSPAASSLFLLPQSPSGQPKGFFRCGYCSICSYVSDASGTKCPSCSYAMTTAMQFVPSASKKFYRCSCCYESGSYVTDTNGTKCPECGNKMVKTMAFLPSSAGSGCQEAQAAAVVAGKGFVQGIVTYTVMDDLTVMPMSSISSITLLNTFAVKDFGALQEKTVLLGYKEGLEILKASLQSKTVLSDVFLGKKTNSNA